MSITLVDRVTSTRALITESCIYVLYFSVILSHSLASFRTLVLRRFLLLLFFFLITFILILIKQKQCRIVCALCYYPLTPNAPSYLSPAGVVLLDKNQGFWLVHSTPHFPPVQKAGRFSYPYTGVVNGQNFICVTYPLERFQTIGKT